MSIGPNDPKALNQAAAHDTALYDRSIQDNQIVALYDTEDDARAAMGSIVQAGFPAASMQVMPREQGSEPPQTGPLDTLKSLFVPDQARTTQIPAVAHGHAMLIVSPDMATDRQHLVKVIEATKPLDFDSRLEQWRQAGYDATGLDDGPAASNVATAGHAVDAGLAPRNAKVP